MVRTKPWRTNGAFCLLLTSLIGCQRRAEPTDPTLSARAVEQGRAEAPAPRHRERRTGADVVAYNVARGGTLADVANLYKLGRAEIERLNPDLKPDAELAPETAVVVFDGAGVQSQSVGLPHDGSIEGAMPMPDGPGRRITADRWKTWGSEHTVRQLDKLFDKWAQEHSNWPAVLVGNLSKREGGPLEPHKTHQSGRDVDLGYVANDGSSRDGRWQQMNAKNLDCDKTWTLLQLFIDNSDVEVVYMDRKIQRLLLRCSKRLVRQPKRQLRLWFEEAPGAKRRQTLIRHVPGHDDHFHVRFACAANEKRCRS